MEHRHRWHRLSAILTLTILLLIPTARPLEHLASNLIKAEPAIKGVMITFGALMILAALGSYIRSLIRLHSLRKVSCILGISAGWLTLTASQLLVPIETLHIVLYGALAAALYCSALNGRSARTATLCACVIAFGVSLLDEGLQWLHPARVGDPRDLLLNSLSSVFGVICAWPLCPSSENLLTEKYSQDQNTAETT
jgi:hypothetical protein